MDVAYLSTVERLEIEGNEADGDGLFGMQIGDAIPLVVEKIIKRLSADDYVKFIVRDAAETLPEEKREAFQADCARGFTRCESPIEKWLLPWLVAQQYPLFAHDPKVLFPGEADRLGERAVAVIPQLPIGRYRADFALVAKSGQFTRFVVVECDGAEYHDQTNQVIRDLNRDVAILANERVLDVVRLTGKEIDKDPRRAAQKAADAVSRCWDKRNRAMDAKFKLKSGPASP